MLQLSANPANYAVCSSVTMTMQLALMGTHQMVWDAITFTLMVECINKGFFGQSCICNLSPGHPANQTISLCSYHDHAVCAPETAHISCHAHLLARDPSWQRRAYSLTGLVFW